MEKKETGSEGNTITSSRITPSKRWAFTHYPKAGLEKIELEMLEAMFKSLDANYVMGIEKCPTTNKVHFQSYVEFKVNTRPLENKTLKELSKNGFAPHWEKAKGSCKQNVDYCMKDGNWVSNKWREIKCLTKDQLYDWQLEILEKLKDTPDERTIFWYWEPDGCTGKTSFCKYLSLKYGAVPVEGKKNDILYCAAEFESDIYVFDLERSMEEFVSYSGIEKIKNGYYMCSKYESKPIIRNCPHVIIFANFPPEESKLSKDRWIIKRIELNE